MISDALTRDLEPLERFEAIRRRVARLGDRLCDLSYANPYDGANRAVKAAIAAALDDDRVLGLQYSPFGGQTLIRRAVAEALRDSHGLPFAFDDVILTPGAMSALHLALRTAAEAGTEVVIPVPCWLDYPLYARFVGLRPVLVELVDPFHLDLAAIENALSARSRAILLSHPGNPTGRNYTAAELRGLAALIERAERRHGTTITLIADETHRDFATGYTSAACAHDRTLLTYSFGKYHLIQGQRLGYVAVSPRHPERAPAAQELLRWTRITGAAAPTALMQRAVPHLLALRHDQRWLAQWRQRFTQELSRAGYHVVPADATMFLYVATPAGVDDFDFTASLARAGVLVLPAPVFHHRGWFRLSLTGTPEMLERALEVLRRHSR